MVARSDSEGAAGEARTTQMLRSIRIDVAATLALLARREPEASEWLNNALTNLDALLALVRRADERTEDEQTTDLGAEEPER